MAPTNHAALLCALVAMLSSYQVANAQHLRGSAAWNRQSVHLSSTNHLRRSLATNAAEGKNRIMRTEIQDQQSRLPSLETRTHTDKQNDDISNMAALTSYGKVYSASLRYAVYRTEATFLEALETCRRQSMTQPGGETGFDVGILRQLCKDDVLYPDGCWMSHPSARGFLCPYMLAGVTRWGSCFVRRAVVCMDASPHLVPLTPAAADADSLEQDHQHVGSADKMLEGETYDLASNEVTKDTPVDANSEKDYPYYWDAAGFADYKQYDAYDWVDEGRAFDDHAVDKNVRDLAAQRLQQADKSASVLHRSSHPAVACHHAALDSSQQSAPSSSARARSTSTNGPQDYGVSESAMDATISTVEEGMAKDSDADQNLKWLDLYLDKLYSRSIGQEMLEMREQPDAEPEPREAYAFDDYDYDYMASQSVRNVDFKSFIGEVPHIEQGLPSVPHNQLQTGFSDAWVTTLDWIGSFFKLFDLARLSSDADRSLSGDERAHRHT